MITQKEGIVYFTIAFIVGLYQFIKGVIFFILALLYGIIKFIFVLGNSKIMQSYDKRQKYHGSLTKAKEEDMDTFWDELSKELENTNYYIKKEDIAEEETKTVISENNLQLYKDWCYKKITIEEAEQKNLIKDERLGSVAIPFGFINDEWIVLKEQMLDGDELWEFESPGETWSALCGRKGICVVRDGDIVAYIETSLN